MDIAFLLRGFLIGLSIAAPIGPISVLCIRRTLAEGRLVGIVSGLGGATGDAIYGCVAGFGLTFISNILIGQQAWLRLIGGLFLCYFPDADKPDDHPFFCGIVRWFGSGECRWGFHVRGSSGPGHFHWLILLVANLMQ
jgi:hypothetical protein